MERPNWLNLEKKKKVSRKHSFYAFAQITPLQNALTKT